MQRKVKARDIVAGWPHGHSATSSWSAPEHPFIDKILRLDAARRRGWLEVDLLRLECEIDQDAFEHLSAAYRMAEWRREVEAIRAAEYTELGSFSRSVAQWLEKVGL